MRLKLGAVAPRIRALLRGLLPASAPMTVLTTALMTAPLMATALVTTLWLPVSALAASPQGLPRAGTTPEGLPPELSAAPAGVPATGRPAQVAAAGYVEQEWLLKGQARGYRPKAKWLDDGLWEVEPDGAPRPYVTRILVRRPADARRFNGTVLVEWMNSATTYDLDGAWMLTSEEIMREGYAWVGVTVEAASVAALKQKMDAPRYAALQVAEDNSQAYDIFTQAATLARQWSGQWGGQLSGGPGAASANRKLLALGYSQSGSYLITYLNAFQPTTRAFDGFYLLSPAAVGMPLDTSGWRHFGPQYRGQRSSPLMQVSTEMEVMVSWWTSDTPDTDALRHWEIAGATHFDGHMQAQAMAARLGGPPLPTPRCFKPVNTLPSRVLFHAGLHALREWVYHGKAPPIAPRMARHGWGPVRNDERGNAIGGLRLPELDVPLAQYGMYGNFPVRDVSGWTSYACMAGGSRNPLDPKEIRALYSDKEAYMKAYKASADALLKAGFLRPPDQAWLVRQAQTTPWPPR